MPLREAEDEDVLDRLLAEVVVDPVDLLLPEDGVRASRSSSRAEARSWPNGFSTTMRDHGPRLGRVHQARLAEPRGRVEDAGGGWRGRRGGCPTGPARGRSADVEPGRRSPGAASGARRGRSARRRSASASSQWASGGLDEAGAGSARLASSVERDGRSRRKAARGGLILAGELRERPGELAAGEIARPCRGCPSSPRKEVEASFARQQSSAYVPDVDMRGRLQEHGAAPLLDDTEQLVVGLLEGDDPLPLETLRSGR